jgi:hypothetical protein
VATAFVELVRHGLPELRRGNDWATLPAGHHPSHPSRNSPVPSDAPAARPRWWDVSQRPGCPCTNAALGGFLPVRLRAGMGLLSDIQFEAGAGL